jgi:hypothetical protein
MTDLCSAGRARRAATTSVRHAAPPDSAAGARASAPPSTLDLTKRATARTLLAVARSGAPAGWHAPTRPSARPSAQAEAVTPTSWFSSEFTDDPSAAAGAPRCWDETLDRAAPWRPSRVRAVERAAGQLCKVTSTDAERSGRLTQPAISPQSWATERIRALGVAEAEGIGNRGGLFLGSSRAGQRRPCAWPEMVWQPWPFSFSAGVRSRGRRSSWLPARRRRDLGPLGLRCRLAAAGVPVLLRAGGSGVDAEGA